QPGSSRYLPLPRRSRRMAFAQDSQHGRLRISVSFVTWSQSLPDGVEGGRILQAGEVTGVGPLGRGSEGSPPDLGAPCLGQFLHEYDPGWREGLPQPFGNRPAKVEGQLVAR